MDNEAHILVIDDEEAMRDSCQQTLGRDRNKVEVAADGAAGLAILEKESFDVVILDLKMPGLSGMEVLKKIKQKDPEIVVVVITGYATIDSAVEAMKSGAYDFVPKPFTPDSLRVIVRRALEKRKLSLENILLRAELKERLGGPVLIGQSASIKQAEELVRQAAAGDSSVLVSGQAGTGKQLVASVIHSQSSRADKPFVVVDCGVLPENLFESELFGCVQPPDQGRGLISPATRGRGGASEGPPLGGTQTKYGRVEAAAGGTVFFDDVADISMNTQAKILHMLQDKQFTRVGSTQTIRADVRVIAATSRHLPQRVQQQTFREDLFYALSVVPIVLPPLRERKEDVPLLAAYFLAKYNKEREKSVTGISDSAMKLLTEYDWPGNVRELENVMERAVVLAKGRTIEPEDLWYYELDAGRRE
jgi:DNA-binding NtrC family response regulator